MDFSNDSDSGWDSPQLRAKSDIRTVTNELLERIKSDTRNINALITVMDDSAMADAERLQALRDQGTPAPLDGLPIVVKDNIDVAGARCTRGSKWFADRVASNDATVVSKLRAAGAVILGKASLHEFAYGGTNNNAHFGPVRNPWDTERIPGGSSGGSAAAIASDWSIGALGTDTGGSIRCPSSMVGITGLRPTMGTVSNHGVFHISPSFDTVGPMARRASDVASIFGVIVGYDPQDPQSISYAGRRTQIDPASKLSGVRVGIPRKYFFENLEAGIGEAVLEFARKLEEFGAVIVADIDVPGAEDAMSLTSQVIRAEALSIHIERLESDRSKFGDDVARRLDLGYELEGWKVAELYHSVLESRRSINSVMDSVDFVLTPTIPRSPTFIADSEMIATTAELHKFAYPWSLSHLPSISLPCGFTGESLPIGAQLIGPAHSEFMLCSIADLYQKETDWHLRRPKDTSSQTTK